MANTDDLPSVWCSEEAREWWIDDVDPKIASDKVAARPDAMCVTNAYEVLSVETIARLLREAHR